MTDKKNRSPKHPAISLKEAITSVKPAFEAETMNKMSREVLASHLGYSGLSGASAAKIGALRHFGLIEGAGDELRVSKLATNLILGVQDSPEFMNSLKIALRKPSLYSELLTEFESKPSIQNLVHNLVVRGFLKKSAEKAASDFITSAEFARYWDDEELEAYQDNDDELEETQSALPHVEPITSKVASRRSQISIAASEDEVSAGKLSKETKYRLLVDGPFGSKELDLLLKKLDLDREFLD